MARIETAEASTETLAIGNRQISIPIKYRAGPRDLTAAEAGILQAAFRANVKAFLTNAVKDDGEDDGAGLQSAADDYAAKAVFGVRLRRRSPPLDQIDAKAVMLISMDIRAAIKQRDGEITATASMIRDKAIGVLAGPHGTRYRAQARRFFEDRANAPFELDTVLAVSETDPAAIVGADGEN